MTKRSCNWSWQDTERYLYDWNNRNKPPLNENYLRGQIRWQRMRKKTVPPPNCVHHGWYESFGVCKPDEDCGGSSKSIRNPAAYPFRVMERSGKNKKTKEKPKARRKKPFEPPPASGMA